MKIILETETEKVFYEPGEGNDTLVSFSGIDFNVFGFDSRQTYTPENADRPEFVNVTKGMGDRFWVIDKTRTWGCHIDYENLNTFLSPYFEGKNVVALGSCMGATNAIKFAYYTDVHRVIAFTPHWSCDENEVPGFWFDKRTRFVREKAMATGWKTLDGWFRPMTTYVMIWTPDIIDVPHMVRFPALPNIKPLFIVNSNHSVARFIKMFGVLPDMLGECITAEDAQLGASKVLEKAGILHELF